MAGIDVGQTGGARRSVIADIQPIPMIDLMMVLISFLLITAVWSHMARTEVSANVPREASEPTPPPAPSKTLHIEVQDEQFVLSWRTGATTIDRFTVPRRSVEHVEGSARVVRYPDLVNQLRATWESGGTHRDPSDRTLDRAVLHTSDALAYSDVIAVLDAIHDVKRPFAVADAPLPHHGDRAEATSAFEVTFAVN